LDGGASALALPSSEGASVIREGELESHGKWVSCRGDRGGVCEWWFQSAGSRHDTVAIPHSQP
jgi:hypothetical protein